MNDSDSRDTSSTVSVINILECPEMIELSSNDTEKESWSFGSETSNNNDLYYKTRG